LVLLPGTPREPEAQSGPTGHYGALPPRLGDPRRESLARSPSISAGGSQGGEGQGGPPEGQGGPPEGEGGLPEGEGGPPEGGGGPREGDGPQKGGEGPLGGETPLEAWGVWGRGGVGG